MRPSGSAIIICCPSDGSTISTSLIENSADAAAMSSTSSHRIGIAWLGNLAGLRSAAFGKRFISNDPRRYHQPVASSVGIALAPSNQVEPCGAINVRAGQMRARNPKDKLPVVVIGGGPQRHELVQLSLQKPRRFLSDMYRDCRCPPGTDTALDRRSRPPINCPACSASK